jgi:hypothetical protein
MGLDQYLYIKKPRDIVDPFKVPTEDIAYWRKDWTLQTFIGSDNCEEIVVTEDLCTAVLKDINQIYEHSDSSSYKDHTVTAFTKALELIKQGREVYYEAWW